MSGDTLQDVSVNISDVTQRRIKVRPTLLQDVYYYYYYYYYSRSR